MKRLLTVTLFVGIALSAEAREGFGFAKKAVGMTRTIPPATNAGARRVQLTVESERGADEDDARTLGRYLTDHIVNGGGTVAEGGRSEVELNVAIDRLESHETWETYTEYERQQTGTKREWNEDKKKYETKPVYSNVAVQKQRKVIDAQLSGTFDIAAKNKDVSSGSLDEKFRETFGDYDSAPAPSTIEDDMLKRAAKKIAAQIVPTQERTQVLVPRASFEPLIPLAESGEWDRYLAAVEAMPAKKSPKDEAFRHYALAIAKEAIGYQKENRAEALDLLRAAQSHYETAASLNTGEELFRKGYTSLLSSGTIGSPLTRASDSVARYDAWSATGSAVRVASTQPVAGSSAKPPTPSQPSSGIRNQTVIDLAKAGLSDENIILAIDAAAQTSFDVSPEGLIALSKGGVSKSVIAHMQKRAKK
ncbi:MAG TPA: hypothetical protein VGQ36_09470 [Thermoanaerobaculia bacterium]|jgi:hypothetical protein|nr:hypothetical protein [Thermoanaerobaculia bacterium]